MRMIAIGAAAMLLTGLAMAQSAGQPVREQALPGWMAGCWIERTDAAWTEECWTSAKGAVMIGSGRSGTGDRVSSWEAMQILQETSGLAFYAAPRGVGRTRFAVRPDGEGVTFVNAGHDYPQRIRYWRDGDALMAEVSLADGSRAKRWRFKRM